MQSPQRADPGHAAAIERVVGVGRRERELLLEQRVGDGVLVVTSSCMRVRIEQAHDLPVAVRDASPRRPARTTRLDRFLDVDLARADVDGAIGGCAGERTESTRSSPCGGALVTGQAIGTRLAAKVTGPERVPVIGGRDDDRDGFSRGAVFAIADSESAR